MDKYTWVDIGSSYLPTDILAAVLHAQLEARERIQDMRRRVWEYYHKNLQACASRFDMRLPIVPPHCEHPYHMFYLLLPSPEQRNNLIAHLKSRGIMGVFHYLPLHLSEMGRRFGGEKGDCPVTEDISDRLLRLPYYNELTEADQGRVVAAITEFDGG